MASEAALAGADSVRHSKDQAEKKTAAEGASCAI
jgi:hypothetical protein